MVPHQILWNQDTGKRPESWARLKKLKGMSTLPWLTVGDFNEITVFLRKRVGVPDQGNKCRTSSRPLIFADYGIWLHWFKVYMVVSKGR